MVAQARTESSTAEIPPATEPIAPATQLTEKRDGCPVTRKRRRDPDSDPVASERAKAASAHADYAGTDSAPARRKKKKKAGGVIQK